MPTIPFDIEPRFFSGSSGLRLPVNPDSVLGAEWEILEGGGLGQVTIRIAALADTTLCSGGDLVEIWARNADGSETLRGRAIVSMPEPNLALAEIQTINAYGRMEDMNHVVIDRISVHPGGKDLALFASEIADDYQARRPGLTFVRDIQTTGVLLETLTLTNTTARSGMDTLFTQSGLNAVWGWDIDPTTNLDRFYFRPRVATVAHQWFVGANVRTMTTPVDFSQICNGMKLQGGPAKYPQLLTNPSFEVPQVPDAATGDLLVNGGFEDTRAGGSTNTGGNTDANGWYPNMINGASRNAFDPGTNHNSSPHGGQWYLLLDHATEEAWQEVAVTPGTQYNASLYIAAEKGGYGNTGNFIIEGRTAPGGTVVETYTLPLATSTTAWNGGQGSTVLSGDGLSMSIVFQNGTITTARIRIVATNGAAQSGLCVDDVVFTPAGALGQLGWSDHLEDPGNPANQFVSIDWACRGAAWEGLMGVRTQVIADTGHKPAIAPYPGDNAGVQGYHFRPAPQQSLTVGCRIRMSPGLNSADGLATMEYREWAGDGHQTQFVFTTNITIPNDGAWHWLSQNVTAHGDAASATCQATLSANGIYDIDGFTARDIASGESGIDYVSCNYLRGPNFERYIQAEDVCAIGSDSYNSASVYGRRESVISNSDIIQWDANAQAWAKAYFDRYAVPVGQAKVEITHEPAQVPSPGDGTQIRISGMATGSDIQQWPARVNYTWAKMALGISLELSNERPTLAKILKAFQVGGASSGANAASAIAAIASGSSGGGGTTTSNAERVIVDTNDTTPDVLANKIATTTDLALSVLNPGGNEQLQIALNFAFADNETPGGTIDGTNATFTLAHTPKTGSLRVYLGATATTLQRLSETAWTLAVTTLTLSTAPGLGSVLRVEYRY